ncbi:MAG: bifunctional hydroxymethylpyrimidine kinase/phosphomethylpyrimidine kinase [Lachnospiraceae bacterium]|jgi:hydroxymethylpyrimidine/phosphomethylpyrimidine kinase|nr:bifunctional hydroxymethylpyrimidine kinase/phosphomethylpyrimidine kinase [Lachnospiraceae bacterium]
MKKALTIAGSDPSGGAGIQADLKTFSALGVFGMSAITSVVAENTFRVIDFVDIDPRMIQLQVESVLEDIPPDAVKIGMLSCRETMLAVAELLSQHHLPNIVLDPVMYAKNGMALMSEDAIETLIKEVVPYADIVTPNIPEAEKLAEMRITRQDDMKMAAKQICEMGCRAALVKGGHSDGAATDILYDGNDFYSFTAKRVHTKNTHGTGCTFSSAIAAYLARGYTTTEAITYAKTYVTTAITHSLAFGKGNGPTNHFYDLYQAQQYRDSMQPQ